MENEASYPATGAQLRNLPRSRIMQRYGSRGSLYQVPSPALRELQQLIRRSAHSPDTSNDGRGIHQQIWQVEDLSRDDLVVGLSLAQTQLKTAVQEHIKALQKQVEKLNAHVEHGIHLPVTGAEDDEEIEDDVRGVIVQAILARWSHEDAVEEITGRRPVDAGAVVEARDAAVMVE
ncbi:hypothetical protein EJ03DRAFT_335609 [Teratosphaeria nubilosa]|uniref:Uncharacterized protein n=1 Tax=Teratosphaeria nubilosa TaxID=161662 RepID=A0A6G1LCS6_9PEZI|nr:hypothetical protein EJ03DRAFT_335609 [Teratosphaeria nubilosa]